MSTTEAFRRERVEGAVRRACLAGHDGPQLLTTVIALLRPVVGHDFWCASTTDPGSALMTTALASEAGDAASLAVFERLYFEHYLDEARGMTAAGTSVAALAENTPGGLAGSLRWRELLRPMGLGDELRLAFTTGPASPGSLSRRELWGTADLARQAGRGFTLEETALIRRLAPHVGAGLRTAALRVRAVEATDETGTVPGVLVLDEHGRVLRCTRAAELLLGELTGGLPDGWREPDGVPIPVRMVSGLLRRSLRAETRTAEPPPRLRLRARNGRWLTLHADLTEADDDHPSELIVVVEPAHREELIELAPSAYGLTGRERQIVTLVARGASTAQIAATLHISAYTVQNHLSNIFEKTGVHSRRELTRLVFLDRLAPDVFG
jgi:DNA-binding CsgD family transcriptional regulator